MGMDCESEKKILSGVFNLFISGKKDLEGALPAKADLNRPIIKRVKKKSYRQSPLVKHSEETTRRGD